MGPLFTAYSQYRLKDIQLKLVDEDFRPAIVDEDVEGLTTDRIQLYP